jgi:ATP-binding cassette, subfamily F, member 3
MTLVRFTDAGRQFGERWVLRHVSFHVSQGDRWGIVGRNGVGKTTLFRLLTGEDHPTEGEIWRHPGLRFTLMRQNRGETSAATVMEAALEPFAAVLEIVRRIHADTEALAGLDPHSPEAVRLMAAYDRDTEEFRRRGGYEAHSRAEATLEGLAFPPDTWQKPIRALSGGELGRLRLVQTLLVEPDVLLLDEPTNHLDLRSTEWLEEYLRGYPGTVLVVSHDRVFLERLADHVLHLEEGTAYGYTGDFDAFLTQREERRTLQQKQFERQQEHIQRTEAFIQKFIAGTRTKQARSRRTLLQRLERVEAVKGEQRSMAVSFGGTARSGGTVMRLDGVQSAVAGRVLFAPFSAEVMRQERIAIVGPNGCGKTTLMKSLAGVAPPAAGAITLGSGVRIAYYRQEFTHLDPKNSVREEVSLAAPKLGITELRTHLGRFLFSGDEQEAKVGGLSGGEQARVALAKITLEKANVLLLDEPTNHLDLESREALEESLEGFEGTVIFISHDRAFLSALSTRVWAFRDGRWEDFPGGFDEWREHAERRDAAGPAPAATSRSTIAASPPADAKPAGLSKNEQRRREREMERLEAQIAKWEAEVEAIEARLADPALYAAGSDGTRPAALAAEREALHARIHAALAEWEAHGEALAS